MENTKKSTNVTRFLSFLSARQTECRKCNSQIIFYFLQSSSIFKIEDSASEMYASYLDSILKDLRSSYCC